MTAHTHSEFVEGCYRCELHKDEIASATAEMLFEHGVMQDVLDDIDITVRMGGLGELDLFGIGFVWAQNQDALLAGKTTWAEQRVGALRSRMERMAATPDAPAQVAASAKPTEVEEADRG